MTKEELIDKYREINVDHDGWYECVYDWFKEECEANHVIISTTRRTRGLRNGKTISYDDPDISWSGFWSQGDGAAFGGHMFPENVLKFIEPDKHQYPILYKMITEYALYARVWWDVSSRGSNCVTSANCEVENIEHVLEDEHPFAEIWQEQLNDETALLSAEVDTLVSHLCDKLYSALEDEYNMLTSDEAVWDTIQANELDEELEDEQSDV